MQLWKDSANFVEKLIIWTYSEFDVFDKGKPSPKCDVMKNRK